MSEYRCSRQIEEGIGGSRPHSQACSYTLLCAFLKPMFSRFSKKFFKKMGGEAECRLKVQGTEEGRCGICRPTTGWCVWCKVCRFVMGHVAS